MIYLLISVSVILLTILIYLAFRLVAIQEKRKQSREHNNQRVKNLESIIEQANDAMLVIDIDNGKVLNCNPAAGSMLGYTTDELLQKSLFDLQPAELLNKSAVTIAEVWENKGGIFNDIPFIQKNKELIPVECSARVAPYAGRAAIVMYARDIRERLRMENEIRVQNSIIERKNKDILDSINYAKRIQNSVLPDETVFKEFFEDYFIYYQPKDIVSGDFYFAERIRTNDGYSLFGIAVADCTGHGVPGAFMSLVGASILHQSLTDSTVNTSSQALDYLNEKLSKVLKQKEDTVIRDGMDISFCVYDPGSLKIYFSGANNGIYHFSDGKLNRIDPDKQPIGFYENQRPFSLKTLDVKKGDMIYMFTDGYADQFGGERGKKLKYSKKEEIFVTHQNASCSEQKKMLADTFENWKTWKLPDGSIKKYEQVDDVTLIGFRI
jgi:PAS domain S-box-containing protein